MSNDYRCYACCQENCGYSQCKCSCHVKVGDRATYNYATATATTYSPREVFFFKQRCKIHKRYEAKRKPQIPCEPCWRLWISLHP